MTHQELDSDALARWQAHRSIEYKLPPAPLQGVGALLPPPIIYHINFWDGRLLADISLLSKFQAPHTMAAPTAALAGTRPRRGERSWRA